jgi:hypothetical protein
VPGGESIPCDVCTWTSTADVVISPVPGECDLYYIIFTRLDDLTDDLMANYMILDPYGPNPYFPDNPEIKGRVLDENTILEYENFDEDIIDGSLGHSGILFVSDADVNTGSNSFMELLDFPGNNEKKLYISYRSQLWEFDVKSNRIDLVNDFNYSCFGIEAFNGSQASSISLEKIWPDIEAEDSGGNSVLTTAEIHQGDLQIKYVENIGKYVMVFPDVIDGPVSAYTALYFTTLDENAEIETFLGCMIYESSEVYGFNFSSNGNYFYLNYRAGDEDAGLDTWELFLDEPFPINLPIDQDVYRTLNLFQSRIENNILNQSDVLYTLGDNSIGVLKNLDNPFSLELDIIPFDSQIDLPSYNMWWSDLDVQFFRFFDNQVYKPEGTLFDQFLDPACCLADLDDDGYGDQSFSGDVTWTPGNNPFGNTMNPILVKGTLTFESGSKIDMENMEFQFGSEGKIIVKPGARLVVDQTTLTSACNVPWKGVFVEGKANEIQTYSKQGYVRCINGSEVSNAVHGIQNLGLDINGNPDLTKTGGIIRATETVFINNEVDVKMYPYKKYYASGSPKSDLSYFKKCSFISTDQMIPNLNAATHVDLDGVHRVTFYGCAFTDERIGVESADRTVGLESNNAAFRISDYGSTPKYFYFPELWN